MAWTTAMWDERTPSNRFMACTVCGAWNVIENDNEPCPNCKACEREERRKTWGAYEVRYTQLRTIHPSR